MGRHALDVVSLVFGLLLIAVAGLYLTDAAGSTVDLRWAAPIVLIAIGVLGLAASTRRRSTR
jgi:cytochrome c oxidase subunit IV